MIDFVMEYVFVLSIITVMYFLVQEKIKNL